MDSYEEFLKSKRLVVKPSGFEPESISDKLFPFQHDIVRWACKNLKRAEFEAQKPPQASLFAFEPQSSEAT